jgi:hypothetical protein
VNLGVYVGAYDSIMVQANSGFKTRMHIFNVVEIFAYCICYYILHLHVTSCILLNLIILFVYNVASVRICAFCLSLLAF